MKKYLIMLAAGVAMICAGFGVFTIALSLSTVSGLAFMRYVWILWMVSGGLLAIAGAVMSLAKLISKYAIKNIKK